MGEGIDRMKEWFGRALRAADFDLQLQDKEKGSGWKEATPLFLFNKMMRHVNLMMDSNSNVGQVHTIKVVNYALMIATLMAGDKVGVEVEPRLIIDPVPLYTGSAHTPSQEFIKESLEAEPKPKEKGLESAHEEEDRIGEPPLEAELTEGLESIKGIGRAKTNDTSGSQHDKILYSEAAHLPTETPAEAESDPIIETGLPPLDLGPLPNGPATEAFSTGQVDTAGDLLKADLRGLYEPNESEDASYYCPWCEHKSKLASGCHGKICCIKCGKPINSRFAQMLKKARQWDYVIMKKPVTSAKTAQYLGTSTSWAGKVLRELGWEQTRWRGVIWWRWNPPKEDGK